MFTNFFKLYYDNSECSLTCKFIICHRKESAKWNVLSRLMKITSQLPVLTIECGWQRERVPRSRRGVVETTPSDRRRSGVRNTSEGILCKFVWYMICIIGRKHANCRERLWVKAGPARLVF